MCLENVSIIESFLLLGAGGKVPGDRLEFRHRLAISIGAAKGISSAKAMRFKLIEAALRVI